MKPIYYKYGIIFSLVLSTCYDLLFFVGGTFFVLYLLKKYTPVDDKKFIVKIFIIGMLARIFLLVVSANLSIFTHKYGWLIGDSWAIQKYAWQYEQLITEKPYIFEPKIKNDTIMVDSTSEDNINFSFQGYGIHGGVFFLTPFIHYFGRIKFAARLLYMLMGTLSGIMIYYYIKYFFGKQAAQIGACLMIFQPSLIIWSIVYLKDIIIVFLYSSLLYSHVRVFYKKEYKYTPLILFTLFLLSKGFLHTPMDILVPALYVFSVVLIYCNKKMLLGMGVIAAAFLIINWVEVYDKLLMFFEQTIAYRKGFLGTEGINYNVFTVKGNHKEIARYYLNNIPALFSYIVSSFFHYLFEPLPWNWGRSVSMLAIVPQMIVWYMLVPLVITGMLVSLRYYIRETTILFLFFLMVAGAYACSSANIGTDIRHRDMLMPFLSIFAALGIRQIFGLKRDSEFTCQQSRSC